MRHLLSSLGSLGVGFVLLGGCGSDSGPPSPSSGPTRSVFVVPASLDALDGKAFFDHPFPSDLRKDANGAVVSKGFPNPQGLPLLAQYVTASDGLLAGFSTAAAAGLRF